MNLVPEPGVFVMTGIVLSVKDTMLGTVRYPDCYNVPLLNCSAYHRRLRQLRLKQKHQTNHELYRKKAVNFFNLISIYNDFAPLCREFKFINDTIVI